MSDKRAPIPEFNIKSPVSLMIGSKEVKIDKLQIADVMRLMFTANRIGPDLKMKQEDFQAAIKSKEGIAGLLNNLIRVSLESTDYVIVSGEGTEDEVSELRLKGVGLIVFRELGHMLGIKASDFLTADPDQLYQVGMAFWEVNSSGPFGAMVRAKLGNTIAELIPVLTAAKKLAMLIIHQDLIEAARNIGIQNGGTTMLLDPSTRLGPDGPMTISDTSLDSNEPLKSSQASDIETNTNPNSRTTTARIEREENQGIQAPSSEKAVELPAEWKVIQTAT